MHCTLWIVKRATAALDICSALTPIHILILHQPKGPGKPELVSFTNRVCKIAVKFEMSDIDKDTRKAVFPKWRCVGCKRIILHNPFPMIPAIQIETSTARMISTSIGRRWFGGRWLYYLKTYRYPLRFEDASLRKSNDQFMVLCRFSMVQNATWTKSDMCVCECCVWFLTRGCVVGRI